MIRAIVEVEMQPLHPGLLLAATAAVAAAAPAAERNAFEGVVVYHVSYGKGVEPAKTTLMLKGPRIREESRLGGELISVSISDIDGTLITVDEAEKTYRQVKADPPDPNAPAPSPPTVVRTGKSETVAGVKCDHYLQPEIGLEYCVASGMGYHGTGQGSPRGPEWDALRKAFADGWFLLKVEVVGPPASNLTPPAVIMEVQSIERKALPDALFLPPSGYREAKPE